MIQELSLAPLSYCCDDPTIISLCGGVVVPASIESAVPMMDFMAGKSVNSREIPNSPRERVIKVQRSKIIRTAQWPAVSDYFFGRT